MIDILLYTEEGISDTHLSFGDIYLPERLSGLLLEIDIINSVHFSVPPSYTGKLLEDKQYANKYFIREKDDDVNFWKEVFSKTGAQHIAKIFIDSPFLDQSIIKEMAELHLKYLAEFTFSENLPAGIGCEIISKELVDAIPDIEEKSLPLGQVVRSNINQFDIELYYKDPDIREKRLSFRSKEPRDKHIMEKIVQAENSFPAYSSLKDIIENNPALLYIGPSYLEIELTGSCDLDCIYCYRKNLQEPHGEMEPGLFKKIVENMRSFNLPYTIAFGGSGEPFMHSSFYEILNLAAAESLVEQVIIETNGLYIDSNYTTFIQKEQNSKIKTIININGLNNETYTALHGADFFEKVCNNILSLKAVDAPRESSAHDSAAETRFYIQIMKINETEPFLDKYYDFWEKHTIPVILQKQNTFLGLIEDRRYSDLTPLERGPCWHLQRDMYITAGGAVSFCKQDVDSLRTQGNINAQTIEEIWAKKQEFFIKDFNSEYSISPDCKNCDEWYTFNF
ncbi:MAG: spiro-SPASM protein [bacterium]|nr:spiro-SPASM protein [bacterium]